MHGIWLTFSLSSNWQVKPNMHLINPTTPTLTQYN
jgi:hypothetical protein